MIMKYTDINACPRCYNVQIFKEYPVIQCKSCKTIVAIESNVVHRDEIKSIKFSTPLCHVNIMLFENKTYLDGDKVVINSTISPDISNDKLGTYLTFS